MTSNVDRQIDVTMMANLEKRSKTFNQCYKRKFLISFSFSFTFLFYFPYKEAARYDSN